MHYSDYGRQNLLHSYMLSFRCSLTKLCMQVCCSALLVQCFAFNERRSQSPCEDEQYSRSMELTMHTVTRVKKKLEVLERLWLTGLTTFGLWAAFSRMWGLGACWQHRVPLGQHSVLEMFHPLPQLDISDPNLNLGLCHQKVHSTAVYHVHWVGLHTSTQWGKPPGVLCASDQAAQHGADWPATNVQRSLSFTCVCKYICFIFFTLHNVFSFITIFYHTPTLHCFNWVNIHTFST